MPGIPAPLGIFPSLAFECQPHASQMEIDSRSMGKKHGPEVSQAPQTCSLKCAADEGKESVDNEQC